MKTHWTPALEAIVLARYATEDTVKLASELGIAAQSLRSKAFHLGVAKTPETRSAAMRCDTSFRGRLMAALAVAGSAGMDSAEGAKVLNVARDTAAKAFSNLVGRADAFAANPTGRRGSQRWYAQAEWAMAAGATAVGLAVARQQRMAAEAARRKWNYAALPAVETPRTKRVEIPTPPSRYAPGPAPVEGGFGSLPPGLYPEPGRSWATALTGLR